MALELPWGVALTYEDLQNLPEDGHRYELLDGTLLVTPSPNHAHQRCVHSLAVVLRDAAPPDLEVIIAPFDWLIGPRTSFEPDILVARRADIGERNLPLPPVLAVEVLSPSNRPASSTEARSDLSLSAIACHGGGSRSRGHLAMQPDRRDEGPTRVKPSRHPRRRPPPWP